MFQDALCESITAVSEKAQWKLRIKKTGYNEVFFWPGFEAF